MFGASVCLVFLKFEKVGQHRSYVLGREDLFHKELLEAFELGVLFVEVIGDDGNAVRELEVIGVGCVVDQHQFGQVSIGKYSQVLDIHSLFGLVAMVTEYPLGNVLLMGIETVENNIGVA